MNDTHQQEHLSPSEDVITQRKEALWDAIIAFANHDHRWKARPNVEHHLDALIAAVSSNVSEIQAEVIKRYESAKAQYHKAWDEAPSEDKSESDYDEGRMDAYGTVRALFEVAVSSQKEEKLLRATLQPQLRAGESDQRDDQRGDACECTWENKIDGQCSCGYIPDHRDHQSPYAWQPIETAPKDRRVLLYVPFEEGSNYAFQVGAYDDDYATPSAQRRPFWRYDCEPSYNKDRAIYSRAHHPTHWMPLPAPPESK